MQVNIYTMGWKENKPKLDIYAMWFGVFI